jgi:hypothetical protein
MTVTRPVPPLPHPLQPAAAARALAHAAQAAAHAWAQSLDPAAHSRAVSQIHSVSRDLGIATRGLAAYRADPVPPGPGLHDFPLHAATAAHLLDAAWEHLDGVLAAEGIPPSGDPDEPGAALCQAARDAILAWRQPSGPAAERDEAVRQHAIAVGVLAAATANLAASASRQLAISLQAAAGRLDTAAACLTVAIEPGEDDAPSRCPGDRR